MKRFIITCLFVAISLITNNASATTISFDDLSAPATFSGTYPLTDQYASLGVIFSGPVNGYGGAVLSQAGNFGVTPHSGSNFLAFNREGYAVDPETLTFTSLVNSVSIYAAGGQAYDNFIMRAFDSSRNLLATDTVFTWGWDLLSVSATGIKYVDLIQQGDNAFVYDDLSFSAAAVPEPSTFLLFGIGLLGAGLLRRKAKA
uniref:Ice-binding protein C-terminal domain-containing protein n=1 Tax=Geobacter sp. (strain M21) TaxID=443144 RepID=C6E906_GEOSM